MKLTQKLEAEPARALVMGMGGSGKSTLVAKLAEEGYNLHWIELENSLAIFKKLSPEAQARVELLALPDSASYPIAAETLMILFKSGKINACDLHGKNNCPICKKEEGSFTEWDFSKLDVKKDIVVLDSSSQLSASLLANTMKSRPVDAKPERDDWGALRKYTEFFTSQFQGFAGNLVVIAHTTEAALTKNGGEKIVPTFGSSGQCAVFSKAFNDVIYCEVKNKKHIASSSSTATMNVVTKSRSDFKIEDLAVPSLAPLFKRD